MKRKNILLIIFITIIGIFTPWKVLAKTYNSTYNTEIDYRFFVEDNDGNNIEGLNFVLHDLSGNISINSEYDNNAKYYYFESYDSITNEEPLYDMFIGVNEEIKNVNSYYELQEVINKYDSLDGGCDYNWNTCSFSAYTPFIMEQKNTANQDIKKIVLAKIETDIVVGENTENFIKISLLNNTCALIADGADNIPTDFYKDMIISRTVTPDYTPEVLEKYNHSTAPFVASSELDNDDYLNKISDEPIFITSPEVSSDELAYIKSNNVNIVQLRDTSDNYDEATISDYCNCLPVFVQKRESSNNTNTLPTNNNQNDNKNTLISPETLHNGKIVLGILIVLGIGLGTIFVVKKEKKVEDNKE